MFSEAAEAFGRAAQNRLGRPETTNPLAVEMSRLVSPTDAEQQRRERLPAWQKHFTSDDYVEYTLHCPTARLIVGRCSMTADRQDGPYPAWVANAIGGYRACIDPTIMTAARTVGVTLVDLLTDAALLDAARGEFVDRTAGGIGGDAWLAPLLPADFQPPINLRWPEYVTTAWAAEWWIT